MTSSLGVRALQQHASDALRRAAAGEVLEITDRGRPVAMLVPIRARGLQQLIDAGAMRPARRALRELPAPLRVTGPTLTSILAEQREDER